MDVAYHLSNVLLSKLSYPHYQAHSGIHPFTEYAGWVRKLLRGPGRRKQQKKTISQIEKHQGPLFLFPLEVRMRLAGAIPGFRRIWSVRCSCHEYRLVAQGHADFCLTGSLNPWDHAAGALAVTEAGGAVGLLDGRDYRPSLTTGGYLVSATSEGTLNAIREAFGPLVKE